MRGHAFPFLLVFVSMLGPMRWDKHPTQNLLPSMNLGLSSKLERRIPEKWKIHQKNVKSVAPANCHGESKFLALQALYNPIPCWLLKAHLKGKIKCGRRQGTQDIPRDNCLDYGWASATA